MSSKAKYTEIRLALIKYLDTYFVKRDIETTLQMFRHDITGFGTGIDEVAYNIEDFKELYIRDLKQAPDPIYYKIKRFHINCPMDNIGIISCELSIRTIILNQEIKLNNIRLSSIFTKSNARWLMEHMHISFPTDVHKEDESYPLKELEERNKVLQRLVDKKTKKLNEAIKEISVLASTDRLTGLYNRLKTDEYLDKEISRSLRYGNKVSIIFLDIDHFKRVNDNYGHIIGDNVLKEIAALLTKNLRKTDIVGRWGGEEFIVICPETEIESAIQIAEKMRSSIKNHSFKIAGKITASFGVSTYLAKDTFDTIISRVDDALYDAKKTGRNRVITK